MFKCLGLGLGHVTSHPEETGRERSRIKTTKIRNEQPQTIKKYTYFAWGDLFQPAKKSHSCLRWDCILIFFLANVTKVKNPDFKENPKGRKQLKKGSERTEPQKSTNDVADGHENEEQSP